MSITAPAAEFWDAALCARVENADLFHPAQGRNGDSTAKWICRRCRVRQRCLDWALTLPDDHDRYGVYGGLSPAERRAVRKQRREQP